MIHLYGGDGDADNIWIKQTCSKVDCYNCEKQRQVKLAQRIRKHVNAFTKTHWKFVTMSSPNEHRLDLAFEKDAKAWKKLANAASVATGNANPWAEIVTYVGWREITWSRKKGFNLHRHLLVGTQKRYWDWRKMHQRWDAANSTRQMLTPMRCNFDVREIRFGSSAAANYAVKYCKKENQTDNFYWGGLSQKKAKSVEKILFNKQRFVARHGHKPLSQIPKWYYCCQGENECNRTDDGT